MDNSNTSNDPINLHELSKEESIRLTVQFNQLAYPDKLLFFQKNFLDNNSLTRAFDSKNTEGKAWSLSRGIPPYGTEMDLRHFYLSIYPRDAEEFELLVNWFNDRWITQSVEPAESDTETMIFQYWQTIGKSKNPYEYLKSRLAVTDRTINHIQQTPEELAHIYFDHGYSSARDGVDIDYAFLYDKTYGLNKVYHREAYRDPGKIFSFLFKGYSYAAYQYFLSKQVERMARGEDIQIEDSGSKQANLLDRVKLQWTGEKDVLYDLLSQLSKTQNSTRSAYLIRNTQTSLVQFIIDNVEGFEGDKAGTVLRRINAINKDEYERPKKFYIDLQIHRSK